MVAVKYFGPENRPPATWHRTTIEALCAIHSALESQPDGFNDVPLIAGIADPECGSRYALFANPDLVAMQIAAGDTALKYRDCEGDSIP
jgi:hypothetical protein